MFNEELRRSGIYSIKNIVSGRIYVGSAVRFSHRWKSHRHLLRAGNHHSAAMQRSWIKHGEKSFEFSILEFVDDPNDLIVREQHWIDALHGACPRRGFNMSPTAGNCLGMKATAETKAKLSLVRKGVPKTAAHGRAIGDAQRNKIISVEHRAANSKATRQYFIDHPEAREKMREIGRRNGAASKGRKHTEAAIAKMRASHSHRVKKPALAA